MTEGKALGLIAVVSMVLNAVLFPGLLALGASPVVVFFAFMALLAVTVNGTSSVILHYGKEPRDR